MHVCVLCACCSRRELLGICLWLPACGYKVKETRTKYVVSCDRICLAVWLHCVVFVCIIPWKHAVGILNLFREILNQFAAQRCCFLKNSRRILREFHAKCTEDTVLYVLHTCWNGKVMCGSEWLSDLNVDESFSLRPGTGLNFSTNWNELDLMSWSGLKFTAF